MAFLGLFRPCYATLFVTNANICRSSSHAMFCTVRRLRVAEKSRNTATLLSGKINLSAFVVRRKNTFSSASLPIYINSNYCTSYPFYIQRRNRAFRRLSWPINHLPFRWTRRSQKADVFASGDMDHTVGPVDLSAPRLPFHLSEELKTADEDVKKVFTLENGSRKDILNFKQQELVNRIQRHSVDFTSPEVRIAILTFKIRNLQEHFKQFPMDKKIKQSLMIFIEKRNKFLKFMHHEHYDRFKWLIKELGIDFKVPPMGVQPIQYTRKNELRRLTKEYCDKVRNEKLEKFHAKLKAQQEEFLKEKEKTLKWIEEEEKALEELRTKLKISSIETSSVKS